MSWGRIQWGGSAWGAVGGVTDQLSEDLSEVRSLLAAYSVGTGAQPREMTRAHTTTEYGSNYTTGSLYGGFSLIESFGNISFTPDLSASIAVAYARDISAVINSLSFSDISARIGVFRNYDLGASILTLVTDDLPGTIWSVVGSDLGASILPTFSDFQAVIESYSPLDLPTSIGAHLPVDLLAFIYSVAPNDILANIRGVLMGAPQNLTASINITGGFTDLITNMRITATTFSSISATVVAREPVDISAYILGQRVFDLGATISHTYAGPDLRGIIKPVKSISRDIFAWIRRGDTGIKEMIAYARPVVSTHTGPKQRNIEDFPKHFPDNRYLIGTRNSGFSILHIEPIFSFFPDLRGFITGLPFTNSDMGGYIWPFIPSSQDNAAAIAGVSPRININRVKLNYVLFKSLRATASPSGGYLNLRSTIRGLKSTSTGTSDGAGYTSVESTTAQFLSTNMGLVILPSVSTNLKRGTYTNTHQLPDLNAYLYGWAASDLGTSIRVYPFTELPTSIFSWDTSHLSDFSATIQSQFTADFQTLVASTGEFVSLGALITPLLHVNDLTTLINGYPAVLGREILTIHTKPFSNFGASINFDSNFSCSTQSLTSSMGAYIVGFGAESDDMPVSITALHNEVDLHTSIFGLKRIQLKIMELYFRTMVRDSVGIGATIKGWKRENPYELATTITGLSHLVDLGASITSTRYKPASVVTADDITIVNLDNPSETITAEILFASGVDKYIYDSATLELYSEDYSQQWSVLVTDKDTQEGFFDRAVNVKTKLLTEISDYSSFDEAIRESIEFLTSQYSEDFGATISVSGGIASLVTSLTVSELDKVSDFRAKIFEVRNIPDLATFISSVGSFSGIQSSIKSIVSNDYDMNGEVTGWAQLDLGTQISAIP